MILIRPGKIKIQQRSTTRHIHSFNSYDDEINDSSKQVETSKEPIKDNHVHNT